MRKSRRHLSSPEDRGLTHLCWSLPDEPFLRAVGFWPHLEVMRLVGLHEVGMTSEYLYYVGPVALVIQCFSSAANVLQLRTDYMSGFGLRELSASVLRVFVL